MSHQTSWSDFHQAKKYMEELKEELQKTELKLLRAAKPIQLSRKQSNELIPASENTSADVDTYLKERNWRKRKIYSRLKGSHLFTEQQFEEFSPTRHHAAAESALNLRVKLNSPSNKTVNAAKSKYISSRENPPESSSRGPSSENNIWKPWSAIESKSLPLKPSAEEVGVRPLHHEAKRKPKVRFTKWEKEFLNQEVPDIDVSDTNSTSKDVSQTFVKASAISPVVISYPDLASGTRRIDSSELPSARNPVTISYPDPFYRTNVDASKAGLNGKDTMDVTSVKSPVTVSYSNAMFRTAQPSDINKLAVKLLVPNLAVPSSSKRSCRVSAANVSKLMNSDGFKRLQELVNHQKERNEDMLARMHRDHFPQVDFEKDTVMEVTPAIAAKQDSKKKANNSTPPSGSPLKVSAIPLRKVTVAQPPPIYKGFSSVKAVSTSPSTKSKQQLALPTKSSSPEKLTSPSVLRKIYGSPLKSRNAATSHHSKSTLDIPPCIILNDPKPLNCPVKSSDKDDVAPTAEKADSPKSGEDDVPSVEENETPSRDEESALLLSSANHDISLPSSDPSSPENEDDAVDLALSPPLNANDDKENDFPSLDENALTMQKLLEQLADVNDTDSDGEVPYPSQSAMPSFLHNKIGKKRKATMQLDQNHPAPKVRHYDREKVREYMEKQKVNRKKKLFEERQREEQAEQIKKERLQRLYEQQKLISKSVPKRKPSQPLKLIHENVMNDMDNVNVKTPSPFDSPSKVSFTPKNNRSPKKKVRKEQIEAVTISKSNGNQGVPVATMSPSKVSNVSITDLTDNSEKISANVEKNLPTRDDLIVVNLQETTESTQTDEPEERIRSNFAGEVGTDSSHAKVAEIRVADVMKMMNGNTPMSILPNIEEMVNPSTKMSGLFENSPPEKSPSESSSSIGEDHVRRDGSVDEQEVDIDSASLPAALVPLGDSHVGEIPCEARSHVEDASEGSHNSIIDCSKLDVPSGLHILEEGPISSLKQDYKKDVDRPSNALADFLSRQDGFDEASETSSRLEKETVVKAADRQSLPDSFQYLQDKEDILVEGPLEGISALKVINVNDTVPVSDGPSLPWNFNSFIHSTPNPYNFINTFQRKPLVINRLDEEEPEASVKSFAVLSESRMSMEKAKSNNKSYTSDFSVVAADSPLESGSKTEQASVHSDEVASVISVDASTTISSVISTDTQKTMSSRKFSNEPSDMASKSPDEADGNEIVEVEMPSLSRSDSSSERTLTKVVPEEVASSESSDDTIKEDGDNAQIPSLSDNSSDEILESPPLSESIVRSGGQSPAHSVASENIISNTSVKSADSMKSATSEPASSEKLLELCEDLTPTHFKSEASSERPITKIESVEDITNDLLPQEQIPFSSGTDNKSGTDTSTPNASEVHSSASTSQRKGNIQITVSSNGATGSDTFQSMTISSEKQLLQTYPVVHPVVEPLLDTRTVTRVVAEAASAAATSAVIAALEYQKLLPSKKQLLEIMDRRGTPSDNYSTEFENSPDGQSGSTSSRQSPSVVRTEKAIPSTASEHSIEENVPNLPDRSESNTASSSRVSSVRTAADSVSQPIAEREQESSRSSVQEEIGYALKKPESDNVSSASPASLTDNESLRSASISTTESSVSRVSDRGEPLEKGFTRDSLDQLTLDMVKQMSLEDQRRARQQLVFLECQEKALVENARAELKWLELLKKKLHEKKANDKLPVIVERQEKLLSRLRQERAQLRCLQETYRNVCQNRQKILAEKKKLLTDRVGSDVQSTSKKDTPAELFVRISSKSSPSGSHFTTAVPSVADECEIPSDVSEVPSDLGLPSSCVNSMTEPQAKSSSQASASTYKSKFSTPSSPPQKSESTEPPPSHPSGESALKGIKRLEANKRYLTKKEQRLLQRRNHVESLIQWQKKLTLEENAVTQLEKEAVGILEKGKSKSKYFVSSSSPSSLKQADEGLPTLPRKPVLPKCPSPAVDMSGTSSKVWSRTSSVSIEDLHRDIASYSSQQLSDRISTASGLNTNKISDSDGKNTSSRSSSIQDLAITRSNSSAIPSEEIAEFHSNSGGSSAKLTVSPQWSSIPDITASNSDGSGIPPEEIVESNSRHDAEKSSSANGYSDSFVTPLASPSASERRLSGSRQSSSSQKHDSSCSDDSFTLSHSESTSDQSDIERRIYALSEELAMRKAEANRLRKKQKKKQCEQLKEKELSLMKQLQAYDKIISDVTSKLEEEIETASSPDANQTLVKPLIKQPRVAKSRYLQKQSYMEAPASVETNVEAEESSITAKDLPFVDTDRKHQPTSHLAKKFKTIETKEISEEITHQSSSASLSSQKASSLSVIETEQSSIKSIEAFEDSHPIEEIEPPLTGSNESSLSYSSDFTTGDEVADQTGEDAVEIQEESCPDEDKSEQSSIPESMEAPVEESIASSAEGVDSAASSAKTVKVNSQNQSDAESFESGSVVEDEDEASEECNGSNGCGSPHENVLNETYAIDDDAGMALAVGEAEEDFNVDTDLVFNAPTERPGSCSTEERVDKIVDDIFLFLAKDVKNSLGGLVKETSVNWVSPEKLNLADSAVIPEIDTPKSKLMTSLTAVHEDVATKVSEDVMTHLVDDSVETVLRVFKQSNCNDDDDGLHDDSSDSSEPHLNDSARSTLGNITNAFNISNALSSSFSFAESIGFSEKFSLSTPSQPGNRQLQQDWFSDSIFAPKNKSSLPPIDQQMLVRQYPYYYRQIPNKPPPPYTPPSSPFVSASLTAFPKEEVKVEEKVDAIEEVNGNIECEVGDCLSVLIQAKKNGLTLQDVTSPYSYLETSDAIAVNQAIYRSFLFQLTKEVTLKLYLEEGEKKSFEPWLRNQRLTQKPVFSFDEDEMLPPILSEMKKILKLDADQSRNTLSMWSAMKLGRKKRDFVDTVIIGELKEEEADWVNYDVDEFQVKLQLTNSIFDLLLEDTVKTMCNITSSYAIPSGQSEAR